MTAAATGMIALREKNIRAITMTIAMTSAKTSPARGAIVVDLVTA